jgi:hypothetical protein
MRILGFVIILHLALAGQVRADDAAQLPEIVALVATQNPDGRVELREGVGFFSVAITNTGGSGAVEAVASLDALAGISRVTICETDMSSGDCLAPPAQQVSFDIGPGDQRSFAVFIRLLEVTDIPVLPTIAVSFRGPDGVFLGGVETAGPDIPAMSSARANWLAALLLASLVYGAILIVYRAFYPVARSAASS